MCVRTPSYTYKYGVDTTRGNRMIHLPEDVHQAYGFDEDGNLKDAVTLTEIVSGMLAIAKDVIKGFIYLGRLAR
jgi:hypothetical protein